MHKLILFYCLIITSIFAIAGFVFAEESNQYVFALMYLPLVLFFARRLLLPRTKPALLADSGLLPYISPKPAPTPKVPVKQISDEEGIIDPEILSDEDIADINKRLFLKLIGGTGMSMFIFSLFTKRSHAAFFGSMPGPGIISIKDSTGTVVDPAEKQPTDGYEVSEVDDATLPAYYGFMDKDGNWYIAKEGINGEFRYVAGTSSFDTNWANRTTQTYVYFDAAF